MLKQWKRTGGLLATAAALALAMFLVLPPAATGDKPDSPPGQDKKPPPDKPAPEPPADPGTGKIAFTRKSSDDTQLVVLDLDTGAETVLISSAADPFFQQFYRRTWSHTADTQGRRWIVFEAWTGDSDIWAIKEDGTDLHLLLPGDTPYLEVASPALSVDDGWLAYIGNVDQLGYDLYVQRFDPVLGEVFGTPINLTVGLFYIPLTPTWSPGGLSIAFKGQETSEYRTDIFRLDLAFNEFGEPFVVDLVNLTDTPEANEGNPDWSAPTLDWPQGRIAFRISGLWHMNPDGSDQQLVVDRRGERLPSWSPQATRIAFTAITGGGLDIFTINADGSGLVNVTKTKKANENWAAWRP